MNSLLNLSKVVTLTFAMCKVVYPPFPAGVSEAAAAAGTAAVPSGNAEAV